jgi:archaellum biogenesis protein FlaJ (TadC family)
MKTRAELDAAQTELTDQLRKAHLPGFAEHVEALVADVKREAHAKGIRFAAARVESDETRTYLNRIADQVDNGESTI